MVMKGFRERRSDESFRVMLALIWSEVTLSTPPTLQRRESKDSATHTVIQIDAESAAALTLAEECAPAPLYIQGCCHTSKSHWSL